MTMIQDNGTSHNSNNGFKEQGDSDNFRFNVDLDLHHNDQEWRFQQQEPLLNHSGYYQTDVNLSEQQMYMQLQYNAEITFQNLSTVNVDSETCSSVSEAPGVIIPALDNASQNFFRNLINGGGGTIHSPEDSKINLHNFNNLNILPTLEEHDIGGYKFHLKVLNPKQKPVSNWAYSETLNKIFTRMNAVFNVEVSFKPKLPMQQLCVRVMLCFVKDISDPVLRCQNHMSIDEESNEKVRSSLLRCEYERAKYCGETRGKNINDRLSILIPLDNCYKEPLPENDNAVLKQKIQLKFCCQNSCIGRRETSAIFLLESLNGDILAQRVVDVKVCSCPRRDKKLDERHFPKNGVKRVRAAEETDLHQPSKAKRSKRKVAPVSIIMPDDDTEGGGFSSDYNEAFDGSSGAPKFKCAASSDNEVLERSNDAPNSKRSLFTFEMERTSSGSLRFVYEALTKKTALRILESAKMCTAEKMGNNYENYLRFKQNYRRIIKMKKKVLNLK